MIKKAFTLIELLVVIGIMAVIAAGVIATINPQEKIRQGRDATTQSAVSQVAGALQAFVAVTTDGIYPANLNTLITSGELTVLPTLPTGAGAFVTSGLGTVGPVCVSATLQSARYAAVPRWCWCSNLGEASARATCP